MFFEEGSFEDSSRVTEDFIFSGISVEIIKKIRVNVVEEDTAESDVVVAEELREFQRLVEEETPDYQQQDLEKLIDDLCTFTPKTFGGYLALLQMYSVLLILKNPSIPISTKIAQLRGHICEIPTDDWIDEPIKVHIAVERILSGLRSVDSKDLLNICHISQQLWCINDFLFYVALSLTWVAFHKAVGNEKITAKELHRPREVQYLIKQLQKIKLIDFREDLLKFYILLKILSVILNMSLPKTPWRIIPFSYAQFIANVTEAQLKVLTKWFRDAQHVLRINLSENTEKIKIREVLDFEIYTVLTKEEEEMM